MSEVVSSELCLSIVKTTLSVLSAKLVSTLAINARVPGSNPTIDGYFSNSLKALGKPSRLLQRYKNAGCGIQLNLFFALVDGDYIQW